MWDLLGLGPSRTGEIREDHISLGTVANPVSCILSVSSIQMLIFKTAGDKDCSPQHSCFLPMHEGFMKALPQAPACYNWEGGKCGGGLFYGDLPSVECSLGTTDISTFDDFISVAAQWYYDGFCHLLFSI